MSVWARPLYAAIDADDTNHHAARSLWVEPWRATPLQQLRPAWTCALIQRRLGIDAVRTSDRRLSVLG